MPHAIQDPGFPLVHSPDPSSEAEDNNLQLQMADSIPFPPPVNLRNAAAPTRPHFGRWQIQLFELVNGSLDRVQKYRGQYVENQNLDSLGVLWSRESLNFSTGEVPGHPQFFEPVPSHVMRQWLNETQSLSERYDFVSSNDCLDDGDEWTFTGQWEARNLWTLIETHLDDCSEAAPVYKTILSDKVQWAHYAPNSRALNRLSKDLHDYAVINMHRYYIKPSRHGATPQDLDEDVPHCTAFLGDSAPLRRDTLLTSELVAIMWLTMLYASNKAFNKHKAYPIALVAGSGRQVRVHQACFYPQHKKFTIQSSPIISFPDGVREKMGDYLKLLGWVIPKPVGQTAW